MKPPTLERIFATPAGLNVPASPLQRAICRAADGRPIGRSLSDVDALRYFGCERGDLGLVVPSVVVVVAGIRGGKSMLSCAAVSKGALAADLSGLPLHEIARCSIVSATVDNASATFRLLVGAWRSSATLRKMIVGEPTADTLTIRRPDGRVVEIVVVAAHRGGATLRSVWQILVVIEEAPLIGAEATGAAVSAEELLRAAETRLVPGGQVWLVGSPFGPSGLMFDLWSEFFGKPGHTLVVHAPTLAMNPTFPAAKVEAIRQKSPDVAAREYDAQWIDADTAFLPGNLIDAAVRSSPVEEAPVAGAAYVAGMDPATRGNSWSLVVGRPARNGRLVIALAREWKGTKQAALNPAAVLAEIAGILRPYGVRTILTDDWSVDSLRPIAAQHKLELHARSSATADRFERYDAVRTLLTTERIELPPNPVLVSDLKAVRKVATAGGLNITLPKTANGRHSDYAPSVALVCWGAPHVAQLSPHEPSEAEKRLYASEKARLRAIPPSFSNGGGLGELPPRYSGVEPGMVGGYRPGAELSAAIVRSLH